MSGKVKGLKKLNHALTTQLKPFGIKKVFFNAEYAYYPIDKEITYKITEGDVEDEYFLAFLKDRFNFEPEVPFIFYLLHEVGHHKANNFLEDDTVGDFILAEKARIEEALTKEEDYEAAKKLEYEYFNLPDEIMATQWAVNYIKQHPKKIQRMAQVMGEAFDEFYKRNNVVDEEE